MEYIIVDQLDTQFQIPVEGQSIALKEISFVVGFHNISDQKGNNKIRYSTADGDFEDKIPDGLYNLKMFEQAIQKLIDTPINIVPNRSNGTVTAMLLEGGLALSFQDLSGSLGIVSPLRAGSEVRGGQCKLLDPTQLFIHCAQVNKESNWYNGCPCDILDVIPCTNAQYGDLVTHRFESPLFKPLSRGPLNQIGLSIKDDHGHVVNFHGHYIRFTLVVLKK